VVRVNYRGSTGYGRAWQEAIRGRVGRTELADVAAVRERLVADAVVDASRLVLAGSSWGGYLVLLGLGTEPDAWAVGVADAPIADYVAAYEDAPEDVRATDRALFGGPPDRLPAAYRTASPMTYVGRVRAPVLVSSGRSDARCPLPQVEQYVTALRKHGVEHDAYVYDGGHHTARTEQRVALFRRQLGFVLGHLPGGMSRTGAQDRHR
jgi:dipeptidyl aminopeptidase/acylaminoacyl peptidase